MQAFSEFRHMSPPFWAMVKYISETLGYTIRGQGIVRTYSIDEIDRLVSQNGIVVDYDTILAAKSYFDKRAALLNDLDTMKLHPSIIKNVLVFKTHLRDTEKVSSLMDYSLNNC